MSFLVRAALQIVWLPLPKSWIATLVSPKRWWQRFMRQLAHSTSWMAIAREIDVQVRPNLLKLSLLTEALNCCVSRSIGPGECNPNQHWSCQGRVKSAPTAGWKTHGTVAPCSNVRSLVITLIVICWFENRCNVSLVDLTVNLEKSTSLAEIFEKFKEASIGAMKGVVQVEVDELVSCDFQGNSHSAVIDAKACVELNSKVI